MADNARAATDLKLAEMEKHLSAIYSEAEKDLAKKADAYFERFAKLDNDKRKLLDAGKLTEQEYKTWRENKIMTGKHWEEMKRQAAQELSNVNKTATAYVNNQLPEIYATNYNATGNSISDVVTGYSFELVDANTVKHLATTDDTLLPYKYVDGKKDVRWNTQKVNSAVLQGIIQGESIPKIAARLGNVAGMNLASAVRNARTTVTSAENKGRMDMLHEAEGKGVQTKKVWIATHDDKTRDAHAALSGVEVWVDEEFEIYGMKIMYPGDPDADPEMTYNCRCTLGYNVVGFWNVEQPEAPSEDLRAETTVVDGKDISDTWERRPDEFDFEIEDVINAQGFDGLPRVVSQQEFDEAVKAANGGNGFIAQRTYSAPDQETLDAYRDQLYNGDWYVDCSTGGAQYGQGMYCAADYNGELSDGVTAEMEHYKSLGDDRMGVELSEQEWLDKADVALKEAGITDENAIKWAEAYFESNHDKSAPLMELMSADERHAINDVLADINKKEAPSYTETFTLDPSAKIVDYNEIYDKFMSPWSPNGYEKFDDIGSFAAAMGYDAINAKGHGESGSYTVILNRTKIIFKGE